MNPTTTLNFLLDTKPVQVEPARVQEKIRAHEPDFKDHMQMRLNEERQQESRSASRTDTSAASQQGKNIEQGKGVERSSRNAEPLPVKDASMPAAGGETLPLDEETRNFLAALPPEQQEALLEELRSWLASLTPEELQNLQQVLSENPEGLQDLLPEKLQQLLAQLTEGKNNTVELMTGFNQLLQDLAHSNVDFSKVAAIQLPAGAAGELKLITDTGVAKGTESTVTAAKDIGVKVGASARSDASRGDSQPGKEDSRQQDARPERFADVVSRLSRADATAVPTVTRGSDSLQQLLQSAGQGLQGVQSAAATQSLARLAAGMPPLPMMTQAAAQANAQALSNRISMMNAKNMQVAEMRLDPPNLGSVRVQIRMQGDMASIIFQAPNAHARELLEQSLPHLKQMMESEGLMLADAQVSEESFAGQDSDGESSGSGSAGQSLAGTDTENTAEQIPLLNQPLGLIDYYA
jgi:flagellar hook-length control protein FliK